MVNCVCDPAILVLILAVRLPDPRGSLSKQTMPPVAAPEVSKEDAKQLNVCKSFRQNHLHAAAHQTVELPSWQSVPFPAHKRWRNDRFWQVGAPAYRAECPLSKAGNWRAGMVLNLVEFTWEALHARPTGDRCAIPRSGSSRPTTASDHTSEPEAPRIIGTPEVVPVLQMHRDCSGIT